MPCQMPNIHPVTLGNHPLFAGVAPEPNTRMWAGVWRCW